MVPTLAAVTAVAVTGRTATVNIAKWNDRLPGGGLSGVPAGNDFRYAQVWQSVYSAAHKANGICVRMILKVSDDPENIAQKCWSSTGANCTR